MEWTAHLDAVEKDPTNANIIATFTISNGVDVRVTERIPGNNLTMQWLAGLAALRIQVYQEREDAIAALTVGPIVPAPFALDPVQVAAQTLAAARQKEALLAPSENADVQAAQAEYTAAIEAKAADDATKAGTPARVPVSR